MKVNHYPTCQRAEKPKAKVRESRGFCEDDKGKDEPKAKQVKLAQKARKPQAAKNGPKKAHPCDKCEASFVVYPSYF